MKKIVFLLAIVLVAYSSSTHAETFLSAGDIAIIGINSDGDDEFSFLLLKDITASTSIYISDKGWNDDTGFAVNSGDGIWEWSTASALNAGTIVHIKTTNNGIIEAGSLAATIGSIVWVEGAGSAVISYTGDQIFLYQGTEATPIFITGIHYNVEPNQTAETTTTANWDNIVADNKTSSLPDQLVNGVNAIWVHDNGTERDNFRYSCSALSTGTPGELSTAINTLSNWDVDTTGTTPYTLNPFPCSFTVAAANNKPTAASFTASPIYENTVYAFSTLDFSYFDSDSDPLSLVRISSVPVSGTLWVDTDNSGTINGIEAGLSNGETVSKADLDAGYLKYLDTDGSSSSFSFDVNDGTDYSVSTYTVTLTVISEPDVTLSLDPSSSISENGGSTDITATLSHAFDKTVTVNLSYSGTAGGSDYSVTGSSISIATGNTDNTVTLTGLDDAIDESSETVIVDITGVTNGIESGTQQVTCTLIDDDAAPTVVFNSTDSSGLESVSSAGLQVALSAASGLEVTVDYAVTGTAAGNGTDYTLSDGTLSFSAGETDNSITIADIVDDLLYEGNETVVVTLSNPVNAVLGSNTVYTYTITDDDSPLPTVTTNSATDIDTTGATLNGIVNANDTSTTASFEYGLTAGYGMVVTADESPLTGSADAQVSADISGLNPDTTYHFRMIGENGTGISYGEDRTFKTLFQAAVIITLEVTDIAETTATGNGNILDPGSSDITAHGICWNTSGDPTISDSFTDEGAADTPGEFISDITGLSPGTLYFVRAYVTDATGTIYGEEISFRTEDDFPWELFMPAILGKGDK